MRSGNCAHERTAQDRTRQLLTVNNSPPVPPPLALTRSTAGGRELALDSRPPARFISLSDTPRLTKPKNTETQNYIAIG
jgi:hypothetical protein